MKYYNNYDLYRHNTMHLHCIAKDVFEPENEKELVELIAEFYQQKKDYHLLGAGSNVILPSKTDVPIIMLTSFNKNIAISDGIIEVGASVRVQYLIREAQKHGLGGIEYLFSVPCTVGGATVMNAGRGNGRQSIGNYVKKVRCLNTNNSKIETLSNEECDFTHRHSVFLEGGRIVLTTFLKLEEKLPEAIEEGINERKKYALENLDDRRPSSGSIFHKSYGPIMKRLMGVRIGQAEWSPKKSNWISNRGSAKNWQVRWLIGIACIIHRIVFKPFQLEVKIWQ